MSYVINTIEEFEVAYNNMQKGYDNVEVETDVDIGNIRGRKGADVKYHPFSASTQLIKKIKEQYGNNM